MKVVGVLGANGMTGQALKRLSLKCEDSDTTWLFCTRKDVDLRNEVALTKWLADHHVTHVINVAAVVGGITFNMENPLSTLDNNLRLATSILASCHACDIQTVVSVLSTCIFPVKHETEFDESHIFDGEPHTSNRGYAHAKRMLLSLSQAYAASHGRTYVCLVPPNLYGPFDKFDQERAHVVGDLIRKFHEADCNVKGAGVVSVFGTGKCRRQFMFCDDFAELLVWALFNYTDSEVPLIVAQDGDITIQELVTAIGANFSPDIRVEWDTSKPEGQLQKKAINSRMRKFLPDYSMVPLEEGIRQTVEWYRMHYQLGLKFPLCMNKIPQGDIDAAVVLLQSGRQLSMGPETIAFEAEFSDFIGCSASLFVNSGSSANLLAVVAACHPSRPPHRRLKRGDRVAVPALCWSTTVSPLITQGLVPVFIDIDPVTLQIDLDALAATPDLKGVMLVHVLGGCPNMDVLMRLVQKHHWVLIEDTCEAMGNTWKGKALGTFGDFGTFSTFYSHHMTTIEGGFVVANGKEDQEILRTMRAHGWVRHLPPSTRTAYEEAYPDIDPRFLFVDVGFNMRPMEISAVIGRRQLQRLKKDNEGRKRNFESIQGLLKGNPLVRVPDVVPGASVAWLALPLVVETEKPIREIHAALAALEVETRPIISGNFVRQPMLERWSISHPSPESFVGAQQIHDKGIYIGLHAEVWGEPKCAELVRRILKAFS